MCNRVHTRCSPEWYNHHIYRYSSMFPMYRGKRQSSVALMKKTYFIEPRSHRNKVYRSLLSNKSDFNEANGEYLTENKAEHNEISTAFNQKTDANKKTINSNEINVEQNSFCNNFNLTLNQSTIEGVNYYNMTVIFNYKNIY